jgi:hypothetical protein
MSLPLLSFAHQFQSHPISNLAYCGPSIALTVRAVCSLGRRRPVAATPRRAARPLSTLGCAVPGGRWALAVLQVSGADQTAMTLGNTDGEISGLTISDPPTQAEVQALRDACEELADDVRALSALVHAVRGALVLGRLLPHSEQPLFRICG